MANISRFVLGNFTLTFLVIGLIASGVALLRKPKPLTTPVVVEALFSYFLLFSIGFSLLYNFVLHSFFGQDDCRLYRLGKQPVPRGSRLRQLGIRGCWISCLQTQLRSSTGSSHRAGVVSFLRGDRSRLSDHHCSQLRTGKFRRDSLYGLFASCHWFCVAMAAAPIRTESTRLARGPQSDGT
jgi:hypothetical protein